MSTLNWLTELRKKMEIWKKYNRWLFWLEQPSKTVDVDGFLIPQDVDKKWISISISSRPERCWYLAAGAVRRKANARFARLYEENLIKCASKQFFSLVELLSNANATEKNNKNEFQLSQALTNNWKASVNPHEWMLKCSFHSSSVDPTMKA